LSSRYHLHTLKCNGNTLRVGFRAVKAIIRAIEHRNFSLLTMTVELYSNHLVGARARQQRQHVGRRRRRSESRCPEDNRRADPPPAAAQVQRASQTQDRAGGCVTVTTRARGHSCCRVPARRQVRVRVATTAPALSALPIPSSLNQADD
ncbi:hypothetical protein C8R43DRAFT_978738, partial [Mycena crocata]